MIIVQWYYKKSDIDFKKLAISEEDQIYIGDNEVFQTAHQDKVFADSIIAKCKVYTIKEYDELNSIDIHTTFFTRATYCPLLKKLTPEFNEWEKYCICKKPLNPNLKYVNCDSCSKWFHYECSGLTEEEMLQEVEWFCPDCKEVENEKKKKQDIGDKKATPTL